MLALKLETMVVAGLCISRQRCGFSALLHESYAGTCAMQLQRTRALTLTLTLTLTCMPATIDQLLNVQQHLTTMMIPIPLW